MVDKKNTDRIIISVDTRPVSDLRAVNLPHIVDIVEEIQRSRRRAPKMDVGDALNRLYILPDLSRMAMTELDWRLLGFWAKTLR